MKWLWRIFKWLLILIAVVIALGALWWVAAKLHGDDALNPEIESFYKFNPREHLADNGHVAMLGLVAPDNVTDSYGWALKLVKESLDKKEKIIPGKPFTSLGIIVVNTSDLSENWHTEYDKINNSLDEAKKLNCWRNRKWEPEPKNYESCATKEELSVFLRNHRLLLERYRNVLHYRHYVEVLPGSGGAAGQLMIRLQEMFVAGLVLGSENDPGRALQDWMANMAFYQRALTERNSLISRSILMVNYRMVQQTLPSIIDHNPVLEHF